MIGAGEKTVIALTAVCERFCVGLERGDIALHGLGILLDAGRLLLGRSRLLFGSRRLFGCGSCCARIGL